MVKIVAVPKDPQVSKQEWTFTDDADVQQTDAAVTVADEENAGTSNRPFVLILPLSSYLAVYTVDGGE